MTKAMGSEMALAVAGFDAVTHRPDVGVSGESEPRQLAERQSGTRPAGDIKAEHDARVASLLRHHFRDVWRLVRRFGVPEHYADDAAQEVFIIASRRLPDIAPGSERPFLLASAVRVAANLRRAVGARRECSDDEGRPERVDPRPNPEALLDQKRLRQMLDNVLDRLSTDLRVTFVLYELEGLSAPQIAELLGIPLGTVASRLRRAREAFELGVALLRARVPALGDR